MAVTEAEIEIGRRLFVEGWGGDTPEAPLQFMTEDVVMRDILGHPEEMRGYQDVMDFWGKSAGHLKVPPEEIFVNENGLSMTWMAYVRIRDDAHGEENIGKWLCGEGMSRLEFKGGLVCLEIDYWAGPQGMCDDWEAHLKARADMSQAERGRITGGTIDGL
ncbi:MAG: nuclear transport factor 2 family protein [Gammaproteobacteria bacterium]|jgi:hypothetical protein|nr:nuclear transport factor 2 family protein [Gammaproteobacteria bacterium]MBT7371317.1 nuclear transport factor 2 family protein [Gammaproteobacteria bacterium]